MQTQLKKPTLPAPVPQRCPEHPAKFREHFDTTTRELLCDLCVEQKRASNYANLQQTSAFCTDSLAKWSKLANQSLYLLAEHDQKEKEYGIPWRSAFKVAINNSVIELRLKLFGKQDKDAKISPFEAIKEITSNGKQDIESFHLASQADMIFLLADRYDFLYKHIHFLKKLLKEPEISKFEDLRKTCLGATH